MTGQQCFALAWRRSRAPLAILLVSAWCAAAPAALIVDWGGNYVSDDISLHKDGDATGVKWNNTNDSLFGGRGGRQFKLNTLRSPTSGYSGTSAKFYGGVTNFTPDGSGSATGGAQFAIIDNGGNDLLQVDGINSEGNSSARFAILPVWKKADFLNGADSQTISFDNSGDLQVSSFSVAVNDNAIGDGTPSFGALRWWVQSGGVFYVSQDITGAANVLEQTYTTTDFSSLNWSVHNVSEGSWDRMYVNDTTFATGSSALTDVTAVGFYVSSNQGAISAADGINFSSFEVEAAIVPEPSALMLFGLAAVGGAWTCLRRRRR